MSDKKIKSKQLIQYAFYDLLQEKDFESISIKEICEKAGVSRMSFYRYYSTKEDIFVVVCDETFDKFFHTISHASKQMNIHDMLLIFFEGLNKSHREIEILKKARREIILLSQFEQYASYVASKLNITISKEKGSPFSTPYFSGGLFNVVMRWSNRNYVDTPEEMARLMIKFIATEN